MSPNPKPDYLRRRRHRCFPCECSYRPADPRPDVVDALPQVTAENSGWSGTIEMDELPENGRAACALLDDDAVCLVGEKMSLDD